MTQKKLVRCIERDPKERQLNNLVYGEVYAVIEEDGHFYNLDTEQQRKMGTHWCLKRRFEVISGEEASEDTSPPEGKETNPKDAVGIKKPPMSVVPLPVLSELGIGMLEGARKYGRHNYRNASVRASVYFDAVMRHMFQWWEGEDNDPDSGLNHVTKAIASLAVLRDGMMQGKFIDDRPPASKEGWLRDMQKQVDELFEKYPTSAPAHTEIDKHEK